MTVITMNLVYKLAFLHSKSQAFFHKTFTDDHKYCTVLEWYGSANSIPYVQYVQCAIHIRSITRILMIIHTFWTYYVSTIVPSKRTESSHTKNKYFCETSINAPSYYKYKRTLILRSQCQPSITPCPVLFTTCIIHHSFCFGLFICTRNMTNKNYKCPL